MTESKQSQRDLWYTIKQNNVCTVGDTEGEKRGKGKESFFEEICTNLWNTKYTNLRKRVDIQIQESQQPFIMINPKRGTQRKL